MRRIVTCLLLLCATSALYSGAAAQNGTEAQFGDPPVAALISISAPDEDGIVTIRGAAGAVFPAAEVVVRNLNTEETTSVQAGVTGSFTAQLYGPGNTPFWISIGRNIPNELVTRPGSLPGGPGTILYGAASEQLLDTTPITQLLTDGDLSDWAAYPAAAFDDSRFGLLNNTSLYAAFEIAQLPDDFAAMRLTFSLDGAVYALTFDPRLAQISQLERLDPNPNTLPPLSAAFVLNGTILELRFAWGGINVNNPTIESATLGGLEILGTAVEDSAAPILSSVNIDAALPILPEEDGIARTQSALPTEGITRFTTGGALGAGAGRWNARGRIGTLALDAGDPLQIELDVTMTATLPADLTALSVGAEIWLQRVIDSAGLQTTGGVNSLNGITRARTASGMPLDNVNTDIYLGEVQLPPQRLLQTDLGLQFALDINLPLPEDLPNGIYTLAFQGFAQLGDQPRFAWVDAGFFGAGAGISRVSRTRFPVVLNAGGITGGRLAWALFYDNPSDGSRGILPDEDSANFALSNRTRYDSARYVLPPGNYPLEPYLLNQLPNAYDSTSVPLIPFFFPGGRLSGEVRQPGGQVVTLGSAPIVQNRISTEALDDSRLFSAQSPIDAYRLTSYNPTFTSFAFTQYGEHTITLTGSIEDVYGNRFEGGGSYHVTIAELLDLTPGVLPGTPFTVGDAFNPTVNIAPAVAADVTVRVRLYPLDGGEFETVYEGQANAFGYFHPRAAEPLRFNTPGEYIVDYEARFLDSEGRLWVGSQRSAGVVAGHDSTIIAHGQRGIWNVADEFPPAWYNTERYPIDATLDSTILNMPYHSGDVAWLEDLPTNGINPLLSLQDVGGSYSAQTLRTAPALADRARFDTLPVAQEQGAYGYLSAARPGVTVRQFVQCGDEPALAVHFDADDPANGQLGAGPNGMLPGDFVFLFGGVIVRDDTSGVFDSAGYAAFATIIDPRSSDTLGARVYPPLRGADGGADGGTLLVLRDTPINTFFHLTGIQPGQILLEGDTFAIAGQAAPTLSASVQVTLTSPSGVVRTFSGQSNERGYFYDPEQDFAADEIGIWTVHIIVQPGGRTSAGIGEAPLPVGTVLGTTDGTFPVYVVADNNSTVDPLDGLQQVDAIQAASPQNFNIALPLNWTEYDAYATVTMPGYLLRTDILSVGSQSFSYQYNVGQIARDFVNLETDGRPSGAAGSDVVTITLVVTGVDESGAQQIRARRFTVMHDRLLAPQ